MLFFILKEKKWQKERRTRLNKMGPTQERDPTMALLSIERFLEEGMTEIAAEKLKTALHKWPDDTDLIQMKEKIARSSH